MCSCRAIARVVAALVVTLASAVGLAASPEKPKAAVLALVPSRVDAETVEVLDELLLAELDRRGLYQLISDADMNTLLDFGQAQDALGCDDVACAAKVAGALSARFVVAGRVSKQGTDIVIALKLIDGPEAKVVRSADQTVADSAVLYKGAVRAAVARLVAAADAPPAATGSLEVTSEPAGARCELDGRDVGQTPCKVDNLAARSYRLRLTLDGYAPHYDDVTIEGGQVTSRSVEMEGHLVAVTITLQPADAQVFVDDEEFDVSEPIQAEPGTHVIKASAPGFETQTVSVDVKPSQPITVELTLVAKPAQVAVQTEPTGALVRLDGKDAGRSNTTLALTPGPHDLRLDLQGYEVVRQQLDLKPGQEQTLTLTLQPELATTVQQRWFRRLTFGLGAVAVVGLGVFAWKGLEARSLDNKAQDFFAGTPDAKTTTRDARRAAITADVALVTTLLTALPGAYFAWRVEW